MDKTVPKKAAAILDLIGSVEAPAGYDTFYGNRKWRKRPTEMTVGEAISSARERTQAFGSSAMGRYQFMGATLSDLQRELKLSSQQVLTPDVQDRLAYHLLRRRGYDAWDSKQTNSDEFMIGLAKEWASFPVPYDMRGATRQIKRGQSYYAGDQVNKALITATAVWRFLEKLRADEIPDKPRPPVLKPPSVQEDKSMISVLGGILAQVLPEIIKGVVTTSVRDPNVPLESSRPQVAANEVAAQVIEQIQQVPQVQHATNNEPWYQSRVTLGSIVTIVSSLVVLIGLIRAGITDASLLTPPIAALGGAAVALYGRWVATVPLPIGPKASRRKVQV